MTEAALPLATLCNDLGGEYGGEFICGEFR